MASGQGVAPDLETLPRKISHRKKSVIDKNWTLGDHVIVYTSASVIGDRIMDRIPYMYHLTSRFFPIEVYYVISITAVPAVYP